MALASPRVAAAALAVLALGLGGAALGSERGGDLVELTLAPGEWSPPTLPEAPATSLTLEGSVPTLPAPDPFEAPFSQVFAGVVRIRSLEAGALGVGTGFVVGDGTWVLTNRHVVAGATNIELETWDGRSAGAATLVDVAPGGQDLALLRLEGPALRPLALGMGGTPTRGDELVTAGYPGGRLLVRTVGTFDFVGRAGGTNVLVTDLPCEPGCSGSPVLDVDGRVVGVIVGGTALEQTLAIPIDDASTLLAAHGIAS